jgi:hypothetical protein
METMEVLLRFAQILRRVLPPVLFGAVLAGCAYRGGDIGNPLVRKAQWLSYIGGNDIRATCAAGTPDRFRLVYNGVYGRQLRMYDLDSLQRVLVARATPPVNADQFSVGDPLNPWRARESRARLDPAQYQALVAAFAASGMFGPPPVGLDLPSHSFYWTAAYCRDGHFGFHAWKYPSAAFDRLAFVAPLLALDKTGIALAPAHRLVFDPRRAGREADGTTGDFLLTVGKDGLVR